jgi:hypothetical protein
MGEWRMNADHEIVIGPDLRIGGERAREFLDVLNRVGRNLSQLERREKRRQPHARRKKGLIVSNPRLCPFESS